MSDFEDVAIYCLIGFTAVAMVWGAHLATVRTVAPEAAERREGTLQSQAGATECLAVLEGAGVQAP